MDKVVILARVSTDRQEYRRQVNELKSFCQKMDWDIVGTFTNKISGAESFENRKELVEMIEFVRAYDVQRVVCLEISRLGRNTPEALKSSSRLVPLHFSPSLLNFPYRGY